jgi:hypothetical protein
MHTNRSLPSAMPKKADVAIYCGLSGLSELKSLRMPSSSSNSRCKADINSFNNRRAKRVLFDLIYYVLLFADNIIDSI